MSTSSSVLLPPGGQRILVVQAHPDDAEHLCGGTIALLAAEGKEIHYLFVTRGDKGSEDSDMTPELLASIREHEQRQAAELQGVQTVTFLVVDKKIAALRCHESQTKNMDISDWVRRRGNIAGVEHKFKYAEAFHHYVMG